MFCMSCGFSLPDSSCFRVSMLTFTTTDGDTGVNVSAEDVMTIMESLKVK